MTANAKPISVAALQARRAEVEKVFAAVEWESNTKALIECPGVGFHNTRSAEKDCAVFLDGVPTISCFHQSCADVVAEANKKLRRAIREGEAQGDEQVQVILSAEQKAWQKKKDAAQALRTRAQSALPLIIAQYPWPLLQARTESPMAIPADPLDHWQLFLKLFEPDDIIWVGTTYDSGEPHHVNHFLPVAEWRKFPQAPHQFTCPSTFKPGTYSRSNENVLKRRYLVVESDVLTKDEILAVFQWLRQKVPLHAIVDTAGKSLHGWFEYPYDQHLEELKVMLPAMGCDPALFKPSQPCRVPGCWRENKVQSLIWFRGGAQE